MNKENTVNVFEQLKIDEGIKYEVYHDHLGLPTFGVGHLVTPADPENGEDVGFEVSEERVWEVFQTDLQTSILECCALYETGTFEAFPGEVQEILVNMMFNMGRTRLSKFKNFNGAIAEGDWKRAGVEGRDSLWHRQVTNRAERLMVTLENI